MSEEPPDKPSWWDDPQHRFLIIALTIGLVVAILIAALITMGTDAIRNGP